MIKDGIVKKEGLGELMDTNSPRSEATGNISDNILVVSDNIDLYNFISEVFSKEPYKIINSQDRVDAFGILESKGIKVVLCEHHFPGMDGIEFMKNVREKYPHTVRIIVSRQLDFNMLVRAINECDIYRFLYKGNEPEEFKSNIKSSIEKYNNSQRNFLLKQEMSRKNIELETLNIHLEERFYDRTSQLLRAKKELEDANIQLTTNLRNISEIKDSLGRRVKELEILNNLVTTFYKKSATVNEFLTQALENAITTFHAETGFLIVSDNDTKTFEVRIGVGKNLERIGVEKNIFNKGVISNWVYQNKQPLLIKEAKSDTRFTLSEYTDLIKSVISVPLSIRDKIYGVLIIVNRINGENFSEDELNFLVTLAGEAAMFVEKEMIYDDLQRNYLETVYSLVNTIEAKDPYTRGHTERVKNLVVNIANEMSLTEGTKEMLQQAAVLHDIGKIGIDGLILRKPGKLTDEEFNAIKKHSIIGENIIKPIHFLKDVLPIIRGHHERLDGSGYPDGLKGEEVSQLIRIIAVVDVFEAMTSDRPYRKAMTNEEALTNLRNDAKKYDSQIVEILFQMIHKSEKTI